MIKRHFKSIRKLPRRDMLKSAIHIKSKKKKNMLIVPFHPSSFSFKAKIENLINAPTSSLGCQPCKDKRCNTSNIIQDNSVILASEKLDLMHYIDDESTDILLKLKCRHQSVQKCMINLNIYQSNLANYRYIGDYFNKNQIPNSLCHFTNVECLNKNEYPAEKDNRYS
ncbi:hypothetical protein GJ496_004314 [Pomphorhynchus laevis]|nr:hypothetical protein GJ496_004314 [Pomphorhynchus laevis]